MKLHQLKPAAGATKNRKRLGRGVGSGLGKTAGRGTKGHNSRSGGGVRPGLKAARCHSIAGCRNAASPIYSRKRWPLSIYRTWPVLKAGSVVDEAALVRSGLVKGPP